MRRDRIGVLALAAAAGPLIVTLLILAPSPESASTFALLNDVDDWHYVVTADEIYDFRGHPYVVLSGFHDRHGEAEIVSLVQRCELVPLAKARE